MKKRVNFLSLSDMDIGTFVNYELTTESLTTKLFRVITLNRIPLNQVKDFRKAGEEDITRLNRLNWFSPFKRKSLAPVYTLQTTEKSPRIFLRLHHGSYVALEKALSGVHGE